MLIRQGGASWDFSAEIMDWCEIVSKADLKSVAIVMTASQEGRLEIKLVIRLRA